MLARLNLRLFFPASIIKLLRNYCYRDIGKTSILRKSSASAAEGTFVRFEDAVNISRLVRSATLGRECLEDLFVSIVECEQLVTIFSNAEKRTALAHGGRYEADSGVWVTSTGASERTTSCDLLK